MLCDSPDCLCTSPFNAAVRLFTCCSVHDLLLYDSATWSVAPNCLIYWDRNCVDRPVATTFGLSATALF